MQTMTAGALQAALLREELLHAAAPARLADETYAPPRLDWLLRDFDTWFRACLPQLGLGAYLPEAGDCDDYADLYATLARVCHRGTPGPGRAALPIGVLRYIPAGRRPHAINVAMTSDRGLVFIEPQQPRTTLVLTASERRSAWLLVI